MSTDQSKVTKEELISYIKEWMQIEKSMKALQKEIKTNRDRKKQLTENLVTIMKNNDLECFDINNGKLLYTKNKVKSTINKPYLLDALSKYFENDPNVQVDEVGKFIMENRVEKIKENIRCKMDKF
jgi:nucleoside-triphosphatase THEP1